MTGLNKAYFIGRIGQDPETRLTGTGVTMVKLSLATPRSYKKGAEWVEITDWHKLTAFGNNAEYLAKYVKKGSAVAVECSVQPAKWVDRSGITQYSTTLMIERVLWVTDKRMAPMPVKTADDRDEYFFHDEPTEQAPMREDEAPPPEDDDYILPYRGE